MPNGGVGASYSKTLTSTGGAPPVAWSIASGALPSGLTLDPSTGVISGTPTAATGATPAQLTVRAVDTNLPTGQSDTKQLSIAIAPTANPAKATIGTPYWSAVPPFNGVAPYHWSIVSGALPGGLTLNATTGAISGTPNTEGRFSFAVQVADSKPRRPNKVTTNLTITVAPIAITIAPPTLGAAPKGVKYTAALTAAGGAPAYHFVVTTGRLPAGVSLSGAGVLSGKPSTRGTYTFTVTAVDRFGFTGTHSYTIVVS